MKQFLLQHKYFLYISFCYFIVRSINLDLLPLFNDEGIYLDWGWREITVPGNLFYSLYDAKQPLLMWLFGINMHIFSDALIAGRVVSVCMGFITCCGLYKIGNTFFSRKIALLASFLYVIIPLFVFFDRQALMESAVGAIGVWAIYYTAKVIDNPQIIRYEVFLGIILGVGIFIKTSSFLFIIGSCTLILMYTAKENKSNLLKIICRIIGCIGITAFLLLIQPDFWKSLSTNSRYSLSLNELVSFPLSNVISNVRINIEVIMYMITPLLSILLLYSIYYLWKEETNKKIVLVWFFVMLFLQTVIVRSSTQRYLVSYLPIVTICIAYGMQRIIDRFYKFRYPILATTIAIPLVISLFQIFSPITYFSVLASFTTHSDKGQYITSATAGYGISEIRAYLEDKAVKKKIYVTTALNTGNPESALRAYFARNNNIDVVYFDGQMFDNTLNSYDCLQTDREFYFVSRDEQQASLNKFFTEIKRVTNPYGTNTIGIYTLKTPCKGKMLPISMQELIQYEK